MEINGIGILITFISGFLVAQIYKLISGLVRNYRTHEVTNFKTAVQYFMRSGGMPSGHAASFAGATMYILLMEEGITPLSALAICMLVIILYDACHVRYAVGEIGESVNRLLVKNKQKELRIVEGHTLAQVIVGTILGIVLGFAVYFVMYELSFAPACCPA